MTSHAEGGPSLGVDLRAEASGTGERQGCCLAGGLAAERVLMRAVRRANRLVHPVDVDREHPPGVGAGCRPDTAGGWQCGQVVTADGVEAEVREECGEALVQPQVVPPSQVKACR